MRAVSWVPGKSPSDFRTRPSQRPVSTCWGGQGRGGGEGRTLRELEACSPSSAQLESPQESALSFLSLSFFICQGHSWANLMGCYWALSGGYSPYPSPPSPYPLARVSSTHPEDPE